MALVGVNNLNSENKLGGLRTEASSFTASNINSSSLNTFSNQNTSYSSALNVNASTESFDVFSAGELAIEPQNDNNNSSTSNITSTAPEDGLYSYNDDSNNSSESSTQNTNYSSTPVGELLKSIENIKSNLKDLLEKAKNPFNPTKKELLEAIYISMTSQCIDNVDLNYSNLREMKNEIDSLTKEIEDTRKNEMYQEVSEAGATRMLFDYMSTTGESLEESLDNFTLAFKCKNEYGDIIYFYGEPGKIIGTDYEILEEISYRDMYGDSESCKKLHEIIPKRQEIYKDGFLGAFGDEQTKEVQNITWTQEQKEYYLKLGEQVMSEGYHDYFTDNEETLKLIEKRDTLKYIEEYIDSELNYYLKNIDPYVNAEDFDQHNNYLDNNDALYSICHGGSYKSGYVETKNITNVEDMINILSCVLNNTGNTFQDNIYIHDENGETIGIYKITSMDDTFVHYYRDWKDTLSDEEVQIFNYINNTDGATAAYKYLQDISRNIDQRWVSAERLKDKEWAAQNKFLSSVGSVFLTPFEGINAAYHSIESLITKEDLYGTDVYSKGDQLREGVAESIDNDVLSFFYGIGMSAIDTISLMGLNKLTGGTISLVLSAVTMGSRAYVSALNDALARGVDNDKAISYAFGASVIETICENYSLGHLMNLEDKIGEKTLAFIKNVAPENSLKSKILYIAAGSLTQGLAEGEEELCTEILNTFYDQIICDEKSNFNLAIQSYKAQGMSEDEAIINAFRDEATECSLSFAGGFLSGVGFGCYKSTKASVIATKEKINIYDSDSQIKEMQNIDDINVTTSSTPKKVVSILKDALSTSLYTIKDTKTKVSSLFNNTLKTDKIDLKFKEKINNESLPDFFYKNKYVEFWKKHNLQTELSELNIAEDFSEENIINFINYYSQRETDINLDYLNLFNDKNSSILSKIENPEFLHKMILNNYKNIIDNIEVLNNNLSLKFIENNANMIDSLLKNNEFIKIIDDESISSEIKEYLIKNYNNNFLTMYKTYGKDILSNHKEYIKELSKHSDKSYFEKLKRVFVQSENKEKLLQDIEHIKNMCGSKNTLNNLVISAFLNNPNYSIDILSGIDFDMVNSTDIGYGNIKYLEKNRDNSFAKEILHEIGKEYGLGMISPINSEMREQLPNITAEFAQKYADYINLLNDIENAGSEFDLEIFQRYLNDTTNFNEFFIDLIDCTVVEKFRNDILDVNNPDQLSKYPKTTITYKGKEIEVITIDDYDFTLLVSGLGEKTKADAGKIGTYEIASQITNHPEWWIDMSVKGNDKISMSRISASDFYSWDGVVVGFSNIRKNQIVAWYSRDAGTSMSIKDAATSNVTSTLFKLDKFYTKENNTFYEANPIHYEEIRANRYLYNEEGNLEKYPPDYIVEKRNIDIREESLEWASLYGQKIVRFDYNSIFSKAKNECLSLIQEIKNGSLEFSPENQRKLNKLGSTLYYFRPNADEYRQIQQEYCDLIATLMKNAESIGNLEEYNKLSIIYKTEKSNFLKW